MVEDVFESAVGGEQVGCRWGGFGLGCGGGWDNGFVSPALFRCLLLRHHADDAREAFFKDTNQVLGSLVDQVLWEIQFCRIVEDEADVGCELIQLQVPVRLGKVWVIV